MVGNSFFRYLTVSEADLKWGMYISAGGFEKVKARAVYPQPNHPSAYYFKFDTGRVLREFQIIYITKGSGTLVTKSAGKLKVKEGSVFVLYPDEWHTYRPDRNEGWDEYWFSFNGAMGANIMENNGFFSREQPVLYVGHREVVFQLYEQIIETIKTEPPGYQQIAAGMAVHLFGRLFAITRVRQFEGKIIEDQIRKAIIIFRENTMSNISPESVADQLNLGYSWFRKMFKNYTGLSPAKYFQQMKMQRAKELLLTTNMPIKKIAYELGFESIYYFSRQFKNVTDYSPSDFKHAFRVKEGDSLMI